MNKETLAGLFAGNVAIYTYGSGFIPLMPIYEEMRGASAEFAGSYLAIAFVSLAAGAILGGRLSDAVPSRRLLLIAAGVLSVPVTWLLGRGAGALVLTLTTAASWFPLGLYMAVSGAIAGREAEPSKRGRVFGLLGTTGGIGAVIGSAFSGTVAEAWGYPTLLAVMAGSTTSAASAELALCSQTLPI